MLLLGRTECSWFASNSKFLMAGTRSSSFKIYIFAIIFNDNWNFRKGLCSFSQNATRMWRMVDYIIAKEYLCMIISMIITVSCLSDVILSHVAFICFFR